VFKKLGNRERGIMDTIVDIERCADDFVFFCENYCKLLLPNGELFSFKLYEYQKSFINAMENNRFLIATKFRQGGFTTLGTLWFLWNCVFKPDQRCMIVNKTDSESRYCMDIVNVVIENLPDSLKVDTIKNNMHEIHFTNGSILSSFTFEASRGRTITKLFVNEAAFFKDMEYVWKCLYPCISEGSSCCVVSTPYENKGWFYDTYKDALQGKNSFKIWKCDYTDHPEYKSAKWQKETYRNLGHRSWMREVLQQFVPEEVFKFVGLDEEKYFLAENAPQTLEQAENYNFVPKGVLFNSQPLLRLNRNIYDEDNFHCQPLIREIGEDIRGCEESFREATAAIKPEMVIINEIGGDDLAWDVKKREKPQVVQLKEHTREEIKEIFRKEHENWHPDVKNHPSIDTMGPMDSSEDLAEFWNNYAKIYPDYAFIAQYWEANVQAKQRFQEELERKVDYASRNDWLCMAGLISEEESENSVNVLSGEIDIINKVLEICDFPKTVELTFLENRLCINGAATWITEESIESAYFGLSTLMSHRKAVDFIARIIKNKLKRLF
jgi:hypothetical protein